jgi:DNA repair exonuclease SbcCD ATPase subunit
LLMFLSLTPLPQVLEAAQQLAACNHKVKNLKLEAQGIPAADLEGLGDALVTLPYVTWLTLHLQYSAPRPRKTKQQQEQQQQQQEWQQQAVQLQQDLQANPAQQQELQQTMEALNAPVTESVVAAMAAAGEAAVAEIQAQQREEARQREQASRDAVNAGSRLSQKLLKGLPGTVLELRIKPFFV